MSAADFIAIGIIILLIICAVRYMIISRKNGKCCGDCSACRSGKCYGDKNGGEEE